MKLLEVPVTIQEKTQYLLQPILADGERFGRERLSEGDLQAWQTCIEHRLKVWEQEPGQLEEDGLEPPSAEVLHLAGEVASVLRDQGVDPPLRVVPNGEGGVVFEWRAHPFFWSLEVERDGALALSVFRNARLVSRHQLS